MKKWIEEEEWHPVYILSENGLRNVDAEVDVTAEFVEKYKNIMSDFKEMQHDLESLFSDNKLS